MKLLGIIHAYNEADFIEKPIRMLINSGHELHVFDHGSTDETPDICSRFNHWLVHHLVNRRETPPTDKRGRQSPDLWRLIADFILDRAKEFDWVTWLDADELLRDPSGSLISKVALEEEIGKGTQVIRPLLRDFWPTVRDGKEPDALRRIRHFSLNELTHAPRGWVPSLTPEKIPLARHIQDRAIQPLVHRHFGWWPHGTVVSNNEWMLDHYPIRTVAQGKRKIMRERTWTTPRGGRRYQAHVNDRCSNLIVSGKRLRAFKEETRDLEMPV